MQRSLKNKFKDVKSKDWSETFGFYAVGLQILNLYKENFHLFSELKGDIFLDEDFYFICLKAPEM